MRAGTSIAPPPPPPPPLRRELSSPTHRLRSALTRPLSAPSSLLSHLHPPLSLCPFNVSSPLPSTALSVGPLSAHPTVLCRPPLSHAAPPLPRATHSGGPPPTAPPPPPPPRRSGWAGWCAKPSAPATACGAPSRTRRRRRKERPPRGAGWTTGETGGSNRSHRSRFRFAVVTTATRDLRLRTPPTPPAARTNLPPQAARV
jgi:hypothetical protein